MRKATHPILFALIGIFAFAFHRMPVEATSRIGQMPKDKVASKHLHPVNGSTVTLASLRGDVVVLDFFATWCGHSKLHLPSVERIAQEDGPRGAKVIGLAVEEKDSIVEQFVKDHNITYPVATVTDPVFGSFVESRDVSVPQTLVYGRDGRLAGHFTGHSAEQDAEIAATVKRELDKH
jgi:cytochrome c biogenesis protein CcmG, thiol:disulfide interchange protein DsbE